MASRPLIGVTTYVEEASWGHWRLPAALIPLAYVRSVEDAGGRALLVPPAADAVEETLDALDGLVLSGGNDVDPATYGADAHGTTSGVRPERDRAELSLLEGALSRDMPGGDEDGIGAPRLRRSCPEEPKHLVDGKEARREPKAGASPVAAPWPVPGPSADLRPNRVQDDVADCLEEMRVT